VRKRSSTPLIEIDDADEGVQEAKHRSAQVLLSRAELKLIVKFALENDLL
jgi:hypothetical protein